MGQSPSETASVYLAHLSAPALWNRLQYVDCSSPAKKLSPGSKGLIDRDMWCGPMQGADPPPRTITKAGEEMKKRGTQTAPKVPPKGS